MFMCVCVYGCLYVCVCLNTRVLICVCLIVSMHVFLCLCMLICILEISLSVSDAGQVCGAVSQMKWTPDGTALAMSWERGGFSIWSVFGSLLLLSIGVDEGYVGRNGEG